LCDWFLIAASTGAAKAATATAEATASSAVIHTGESCRAFFFVELAVAVFVVLLQDFGSFAEAAKAAAASPATRGTAAKATESARRSTLGQCHYGCAARYDSGEPPSVRHVAFMLQATRKTERECLYGLFGALTLF
jgi:hypothetical protein